MPPKTKYLCADCAEWLRTPPPADRGTNDCVRLGLMAERSWCPMCSLITESILAWWDTQDPEYELMAVFNHSLLSISANDISLGELCPIPGSLAVLVGAWDCLHLLEQEEEFNKRLAQGADASFFS